ncbi:MAG: tetratricopeptide repeat protein [Blastocatellia bacterium]
MKNVVFTLRFVIPFSLALTLCALAQTLPADPADRYRALLKMISRKQLPQALTECRVLIESHPDFGKPWGKLVTIANAAGQLPQTEAWLQTLAPANPRAWYVLGLIARQRGQHDAALAMQQKCLETLPGFAPAAAALAQAAIALKTPARAETFFKTRPEEPVFLYGLGVLSSQQRQPAQALELQQRALRLRPQMIEALTEKLVLVDGLGRLTEALLVSEELLRLVSETDDPERRRYVVDYKGRLHYQLGMFSPAIRDVGEGLRLAREYEWPDHEERALSLLASAWFQINYFTEAREGYEQARELSRRGDRRYLSRYLGNLGSVYQALGEPDKAVAQYQEAVEVARAAGKADQASLINFLINLSELYLETGRTAEAPPLLDEAQRVNGDSGDTWNQYLIQVGRARYHFHTRNFREALAAQQTACQLVHTRGNLLQEGKSLNLIGDCHIELQDAAAARAAYQQALDIGERTQALSIVWGAEAGLGRLTAEAHPGEALPHYQRAIAAIEKIRTRQSGPEEKSGYFQNVTDVYQQAIALLTALHRREPARGHAAAAFHLAERLRARALLDSLAETTARLEQRLERDLLDRRQAIQGRLSDAEARLLKAAARANTPPEALRKIEGELLAAVNDFAEWRRQARRRDPYLAELAYPEPFTLEQTQAALR